MKEIFKEIKNYEGLYSVSNLGRVYNIRLHKFMSIFKCKGYLQLNLMKNGIRKNFYVHRLVAEAFIENPNNYPCVNHKDENKANNCVNNLEWCSYEYNNNYGSHRNNLGKYKIIPVQMLDLQGNIIKEFDSATNAGKYLNMKNPGNDTLCCRGKLKTCYGYRWKYK